jgi:hypothetical protein
MHTSKSDQPVETRCACDWIEVTLVQIQSMEKEFQLDIAKDWTWSFDGTYCTAKP